MKDCPHFFPYSLEEDGIPKPNKTLEKQLKNKNPWDNQKKTKKWRKKNRQNKRLCSGGSRQDSLIIFSLCFSSFSLVLSFPACCTVRPTGLAGTNCHTLLAGPETIYNIYNKGAILSHGSVSRIRKDQSSYCAPGTSNHFGFVEGYRILTALVSYLKQPC